MLPCCPVCHKPVCFWPTPNTRYCQCILATYSANGHWCDVCGWYVGKHHDEEECRWCRRVDGEIVERTKMPQVFYDAFAGEGEVTL